MVPHHPDQQAIMDQSLSTQHIWQSLPRACITGIHPRYCQNSKVVIHIQSIWKKCIGILYHIELGLDGHDPDIQNERWQLVWIFVQ